MCVLCIASDAPTQHRSSPGGPILSTTEVIILGAGQVVQLIPDVPRLYHTVGLMSPRTPAPSLLRLVIAGGISSDVVNTGTSSVRSALSFSKCVCVRVVLCVCVVCVCVCVLCSCVCVVRVY